MTTTPVSNAPAARPEESVEERLRRLEAIWEAETLVFSDPARITAHWAFQEILSMGDAVVPLMLRDLEREAKLWVWALPRITGENPVPPSDGGNITKMSEAWVRWGREKGYRW